MRIHHLNCISTCPLGGHLMDGRTDAFALRGQLACHCLLIETDEHGLVLVDTGFGLRDVANPRGRLSRFFLGLVSPAFREEMTAIRQIQNLGFRAEDVRHIVLTHLDFDHAGGLDDFPHARVHMLERERHHATLQRTWLDRQRFRPQQWSYRDQWQTYFTREGGQWFGFDGVCSLAGLPPEILLVPLFGHTFGHAGVAVRYDGRWLLQAGDAYFHHGEMNLDNPWCTPGLRLYQTMMQKDRRARLMNQSRLRELRRRHGAEVEVMCAHDVTEFERMSGRRIDMAATPKETHAPANVL
ncbi:MAG TPA: MBL fold metallo-hydrolase [Burkholderiaceae bacterium]|nr:MBL fold metallo-hydrolase [Burkholderiaceae bacterium]